MPIRFILPILLFMLAVYTNVDNLSLELRFSGRDLLLLSWDEYLFHGITFVTVANSLRGFWATLVWYGYYSLSLILPLALCMSFIFSRRDIYKKLLLSSVLVVMIALPFWAVIPCQDPNNAFIVNLRNTPIPPSVSAAVSTMSPKAKAEAGLISHDEQDHVNHNAVPVSCFPSMHASWTYVILFFAFLVSPWTLIITIPWAIVVLTGGIYLAQHYVVDYLAAIPVAALAIFLSFLLVKFEKRLKKPFHGDDQEHEEQNTKQIPDPDFLEVKKIKKEALASLKRWKKKSSSQNF
ncbi:MAG TPA: phosphatase PAP2 family protein [Candidatus Paceibacterota bacterium]|nr:phosphatase PAP2 family protein [Candidatus Paceibacterota bacterium]